METTAAPVIRIGACIACKRTYRVEAVVGLVLTHIGGATAGYCGCRRDQGRPDTAVKYRDIIVTLAPEVTCGRQCTAAKSTKCSCSCGGDNHGTAHMVGA